ncbi:AlkA N-terminal domain-containing protein [Demequina sp. SYSU T00068]|uniref:DNA-3-methyladenine glycosylase 2 n=1 Tax=Demequina lignilytica TaxID=3051663 RepID=UPI00260B3BFD|nr:DNA-3-methyladenine glycosylase 2 [Demequina sp. SYSU T00068]MDN4490363.1 AlkA N-terminal domain-containing protein [Demequina sp. SYSU T00068]
MWDDETRYAVIRGRDARYDGQFVTAVRSTGIYCRPSCPARTPARANVDFYPSAAAAQRAGFRSCRRCFPDDAPGSPRWRVGADVASRAMRMIDDGVIEREGVAGLAARLGYTERHVSRLLTEELGAGPLALAIAHRLQHARTLLEGTDLPVHAVSRAAGFGSVRQFNDAARSAWDLTPGEVRGRAGTRATGDARVELRLRLRAPATLGRTLAFLGVRAIDGVETWDGETYERTMRLPRGAARVALSAVAGGVRAVLELADVSDLAAAVARVRRLLDLDADPVAVDDALGSDPLLAPLVAAAPGLRVPGAVDGFEMAVRAIVGQQVSVAGARRTLGRLVEAYGGGLSVPAGSHEGAPGGLSVPTGMFPGPEALVDVDPGSGLLPAARWRAISSVAQAMLDGDLDLGPGADRDAARATLLGIRGIGPWTVEYLAMRALGDPDAFPATDLVLAKAAGLTPRELDSRAEAWRPWRAYAALHLWTAVSEGRTP